MTDDYDISPLDLDALRRKHPLLIERFEADAVRESNAQAQHWFAESERLRAANATLRVALDESQAILLDALEVQRHPCDHKSIGLPGCFVCDPRTYPKPAQMARAALADVAGEVTP